MLAKRCLLEECATKASVQVTIVGAVGVLEALLRKCGYLNGPLHLQSQATRITDGRAEFGLAPLSVLRAGGNARDGVADSCLSRRRTHSMLMLGINMADMLRAADPKAFWDGQRTLMRECLRHMSSRPGQPLTLLVCVIGASFKDHGVGAQQAAAPTVAAKLGLIRARLADTEWDEWVVVTDSGKGERPVSNRLQAGMRWLASVSTHSFHFTSPPR